MAQPGPRDGRAEGRAHPASRHRADIDGLRSLAVVPVCLFHAGIGLFSGGFVGVDIFFVISGYLMATVIGDGLAKDRFSYAHFYERRVRRLLPALYVVLLFCFVVSSVLVMPAVYTEVSRALAATVLFCSNVVFWRNSANYFSPSAELNPLLHTWSLAVEEQFYIAFPFCLALVWRKGRTVRFVAVAIAAALSFVLSVWGTKNAPTATFYLSPMRAWEMLLGALVALHQHEPLVETRAATSPRLLQAGGLAGLALIVVPIFAYNGEMAFPGAAALPPCVGAALLILVGARGQGLATRLLGIRPLTFIGKISYSLYLWHWPFIVFAEKHGVFGKIGFVGRALVLVASFIAAVLSWRYVEEPFRSRPGHAGIGRSTVLATAAIGAALLVAIGVAGTVSAGWPSRFPSLPSVALSRQPDIDRGADDWKTSGPSDCFITDASKWGDSTCLLTHGAEGNALLWGDSFAHSYERGFFRNPAVKLNLFEYTSPACPPILGYHAASNPKCTPFNDHVEPLIASHRITTVFMAGSWESYLGKRKVSYEDVSRTVGALTARGIRVIFIGQSPVFGFFTPDEYFFQHFGVESGRDIYDADVEVNEANNERLAQAASGAEFFDPLRMLCSGQACAFKERQNYLFSDYGHYTGYGSQKMVDALLAQVNTPGHPLPPARVSNR